MIREWVAYCLTCGVVVDIAPNGAWIEETAKVHKKGKEVYNSKTDKKVKGGTKECKVLVGYIV